MIGSQVYLRQFGEMTQLSRDLLQLIVQQTETLKPTQTDGKDIETHHSVTYMSMKPIYAGTELLVPQMYLLISGGSL